MKGGLTPKLAAPCQSDLDTKNQESNRRLSGNVMVLHLSSSKNTI